MSIDPDSHEYEVEHLIDAPVEAAFDGFLDIYEGAERPDWIHESELELRVGGEWTVRLAPAQTEPFTEVRIITELDRPRRLAYSMTVRGDGSGEPVSTEVGLSFEARSGQTLVKLDQRGFRSREQAEQFQSAWPRLLSLLAERVDD